MKGFDTTVYRLVARIPRGRVATYGQIAALLGYPRSARAVGRAMKHAPAHLPWHRVVNAQGSISRRANVGGMLTPLGDPPLFLGYLHGVPFAWTFRLWPHWLFMVAVLLALYFVWDRREYVHESPAALQRDRLTGG